MTRNKEEKIRQIVLNELSEMYSKGKLADDVRQMKQLLRHLQDLTRSGNIITCPYCGGCGKNIEVRKCFGVNEWLKDCSVCRGTGKIVERRRKSQRRKQESYGAMMREKVALRKAKTKPAHKVTVKKLK